MLGRREFLAAGASLALAGGARAADKAPVIDTHLHCFAGRDDARFPYHERAPYKPEKAATPEHLLKCMDGAGVDHAIVVHPETYQDDHRYLEHCLAVGKGRLKGTALVFADQPQSVAQLPGLVKKLGVVSVRVHAYAPERLPPFGKPELRNLWKQAGDLGIAVQIHLEPRYAPALEPYIKEFNAIPVIIDHLGRPLQGTPEEHAVVVQWARFPNTIMKLSAIPSRETYPHRDVTPIIKQLAEAWGADRLIAGGGFSADATPASYRQARERTAGLLAFLSATDRAKVLGGTAAKVFKF